jgi:hypothetical protein
VHKSRKSCRSVCGLNFVGWQLIFVDPQKQRPH